MAQSIGIPNIIDLEEEEKLFSDFKKEKEMITNRGGDFPSSSDVYSIPLSSSPNHFSNSPPSSVTPSSSTDVSSSPPPPPPEDRNISSSSSFSMSSSSDRGSGEEDEVERQEECEEMERKKTEERIEEAVVMANEKEEGEMKEKEKENHATEKEKGNDAFAKGEVEEAIKHWKNALRTCKYILSKLVEDDEKYLEFRKMEVSLNLNLALGNSKLLHFAESVHFCDEVLQVDSKNVKALFRKGQALFHRDEYSEGLKSLEILLNVEPTNTAAKQLRQKMLIARSKHIAKERKLLRSVFQQIEHDPRASTPSSSRWKEWSEKAKDVWQVARLLITWEVVKKTSKIMGNLVLEAFRSCARRAAAVSFNLDLLAPLRKEGGATSKAAARTTKKQRKERRREWEEEREEENNNSQQDWRHCNDKRRRNLSNWEGIRIGEER